MRTKSVQQAWSTSASKPTTTADIISQAIEALSHPVLVQARPHSGPQYTMEVDASDAGWGATVYRVTSVSPPKEILSAALRWSPAEQRLHITSREALAATYGVTFLVPRLHAINAITLRSDSTATVWAWRNGSGKPTINAAARQATTFLASRGIFYQTEHIPGVNNIRADFLSRNQHPDDYHLKREVFRRACNTFGVRPTVDLFANRYN